MDTNLRGRVGYFQKLFKKGVDPDTFNKIWEELSPDELAMAKKLLSQNVFRFRIEPDNLKRKAKIQRYLSGRGFDFNVIRRCLEGKV